MRRREFLPALAAPLLISSAVRGASITNGLASIRSAIDAAARTGESTLAVLADNSSADRCVAFLNQIKAHAEAKGITLCLAKFDRLSWGVDVVKRVNSSRVKILFDVYHVQTTEGDIVNSIRKTIQDIGRIEMGEKRLSELNYGFIQSSIEHEITKLGLVS